MDVFPLMLIRTAGLPLPGQDISSDELLRSEQECRVAEQALKAGYRQVQQNFEHEKDQLLSDARLQKLLTRYRRLLRKGIPEKEMDIAPYLLEKRPELADRLQDLNEKICLKQLFFKQIQEVHARRLLQEKRVLLSCASNETICRSLLFSSHSLLEALPDFATSDPENWNKKQRRTASALLKYVLRAATKTTPFSRLATVSLPVPKPAGDIGFSVVKQVVTPNVALLPILYEVLLQEPAFYNSLNIQLNPGLQDVDDGEEWLYFNGTQESVQYLHHAPVLDVVKDCLEGSVSGKAFSVVQSLLSDKTDRTPEEAFGLLSQLIDYGYIEWIFPEKGFAAGWAGSLYNYLGFLPSAPRITDAAFLLQWLRTAARTLSFQSVDDAKETQRESLEQCRIFFERYGYAFPEIPPERIFYEDVADNVQSDVPEEVIKNGVRHLREALKNAAPYRISGLRARVIQFGNGLLQPGESIPFLSFSKLFLANTEAGQYSEVVENQLNTETVGVLIQFYKTETGDYRAVVNGLYPGGGKMMARWLHLFPSYATEQLKEWQSAGGLSFPWQHWSNTNFHPATGKEEVNVPGGRVGRSPASILLKNLLVTRTENALQLIEQNRDRQIIFTDLGLDAPDTRPPIIQVLWHLGVPFVSAGVFSGVTHPATLEEGVFFRKRMEYESIVLSRATWWIAPEVWLKALKQHDTSTAASFLSLRTLLSKWGIPRWFFAGYKNEPARCFDQHSPLLMQELMKMTETGGKTLVITEMLPTPEQWIVEGRAAEWALEFKYAC